MALVYLWPKELKELKELAWAINQAVNLNTQKVPACLRMQIKWSSSMVIERVLYLNWEP